MSHYSCLAVMTRKPKNMYDLPCVDGREIMQGLPGADYCNQVLDPEESLKAVVDTLSYWIGKDQKVVRLKTLPAMKVVIDRHDLVKMVNENMDRVRRLVREMTETEFANRSGKAYTAGKILGGSTYKDQVYVKDGGLYPVDEFLSGLSLGVEDKVQLWISDVYDFHA